LTGAIAPEAARGLTDSDGVNLAAAMADAGLDPAGVGPGSKRTAGIKALIGLHVARASARAGVGAAVGGAESDWPHGRWRVAFSSRADHAGATKLTDRHDPMLRYAAPVLAARTVATELGARATFGKVHAEPGAANAISAEVHAWLDARAP